MREVRSGQEHVALTASRFVKGMVELVLKGEIELQSGKDGLGFFTKLVADGLAEIAGEAPLLAGSFTGDNAMSAELRLKRAGQLYNLASIVAIAAQHVTANGASAEAWMASVKRLQRYYREVYVAAGGLIVEIG